MVEIVRELARLESSGVQVVVVSSGAQAAGRETLGYPKLPKNLINRQMVATVGQNRLFNTWQNLFSIYGFNVGQILLTGADLEDRVRYLNARDTIKAMLEHKIIPVINENDALATPGIKIGDNDNLSARVAVMIEADLLVLLTDQKGLYTSNPEKDKGARFIYVVPEITDEIRAMAGGSVSGLGTGGMSTKIEAASIATMSGIDTVVMSGAEPANIGDLLKGGSHGTLFRGSENPVLSRKMWIVACKVPSGSIFVDSGAAKAILERGSSLLPSGIKKVEGEFGRREVVSVRSLEGRSSGAASRATPRRSSPSSWGTTPTSSRRSSGMSAAALPCTAMIWQ